MEYHDYYLNSYEVADGGSKITLNLVHDKNNDNKKYSQIIFSNVTLYNFIHTGGAIITDINEKPLSSIIDGFKINLIEWNQQYGIKDWNDNIDSYGVMLKEQGYKGWVIESAIGFYGFVIAKSKT